MLIKCAKSIVRGVNENTEEMRLLYLIMADYILFDFFFNLRKSYKN